MFKTLRKKSDTLFVNSTTHPLQSKDINLFLNEDEADVKDYLWEKIEHYLVVFDPELKKLFKDTLSEFTWSFFNEELKKDDQNSKKAWKAYQKLLLVGLRKDVQDIKDTQDTIVKKVSKIEQSIQSEDLTPKLKNEDIEKDLSKIRKMLIETSESSQLRYLLHKANNLIEKTQGNPMASYLKSEIEIALEYAKNNKRTVAYHTVKFALLFMFLPSFLLPFAFRGVTGKYSFIGSILSFIWAISMIIILLVIITTIVIIIAIIALLIYRVFYY